MSGKLLPFTLLNACLDQTYGERHSTLNQAFGGHATGYHLRDKIYNESGFVQGSLLSYFELLDKKDFL